MLERAIDPTAVLEKDPLTPPYQEMVFAAPIEDNNPLVAKLRETISQKDTQLVRNNLAGAIMSANSLLAAGALSADWRMTSVAAIATFGFSISSQISWRDAYREEMFTSLPRKLYRWLKHK